MKKNLTIVLFLIFSITLIFSSVNAKDSQQAWLGITTQTVDEELADAFALSVDYGTIVNDVVADSPADKAQLTDGDVIIAFNSDKLYNYDDLLNFLEDSKPNETVILTVMRDDDTLNIDVTLGEAPKDSYKRLEYQNGNLPNFPGMPPLPNIPDMNFDFSFENSAYIGVQLTNLTNQLRTYFGVQDDIGVLVAEVEEDSPADKAGIKAGDIIIEADNNDISDYKDLKKTIAEKEEGDIVSITLMRDKNKKQFNIAVAENKNTNRPFMNAPDISMQLPHGNRGMAFFPDKLQDPSNSHKFRNEIESLKKELEQLKVELKKEDALSNKELQTELQELKKEIKTLRKRIDD